VDDENRVLLLRVTLPTGDTVWICPGGGIEPGEDDPVALARELAEEVGLTDFELGPHVCTRETQVGHVHRHYLVRCLNFEPACGDGQPDDEVIDEFRWWSASELREFGGRTWPRDLAELFTSVLAL
jgi:ADP-ribose pyrophosphatase YjhB (NUDIX family)